MAGVLTNALRVTHALNKNYPWAESIQLLKYHYREESEKIIR